MIGIEKKKWGGSRGANQDLTTNEGQKKSVSHGEAITAEKRKQTGRYVEGEGVYIITPARCISLKKREFK